jgi:hypothetical protein
MCEAMQASDPPMIGQTSLSGLEVCYDYTVLWGVPRRRPSLSTVVL